MIVTNSFKRLPPESAIPFAGFDFARIPSRQDVFRKIKDFLTYCTRSARSPEAAVILGEWGEGKSEAFERYIRPTIEGERHLALSIDAKAVANSYRVIDTLTPLPADQLLASLFYALRVQERRPKSPALEKYADVQEWLSEFLQFVTNAHRRKVFIFIDEFEDLILDPDGLKRVMAGIKALINGQYQAIAEGGVLEGSLFLFLSCTPDAYNKMRNDPEINQTFGSYERRIEIIDLPPITPREGIQFLWDLLLYAYEQELPRPLPIASAGVLSTIYKIAKGNIGALVSLFAKLLNRARTQDHKLNVLEYKQLLDLLPTEQVTIMGSRWNCLEKAYLDSLLHRLQDVKISREYLKLFHLLTGELIPFSSCEISRRTGITEQMVHSVVREMNRALEAMGISKALLALAPVDEDWHFEQILEGFVDHDTVTLGDFKGTLDRLLDGFDFPVLAASGVDTKRFFPLDAASIQGFLKGATSQDAATIAARVPQQVREVYYCTSPEIVAQLYPTPAPPALDYVKDPELKAETWRRVSSSFDETFHSLGVAPFLTVIRECSDLPFTIEPASYGGSSTSTWLQVRDARRETTIETLAFACFGHVSGETLSTIEKLSTKANHTCKSIWIFHTGEHVTKSAEAFRSSALWDKLMFVYCHPTLTKRIMAAHLLKTAHLRELSLPFFKKAVAELLITELRLPSVWEEWLSQAARKGIAVKDLIRSSARSEKELVDGMKFYLNCIDEVLTSDDAFDKNVQLRAFTVFDTKIGLIPDIESTDQLSRITTDLQANGLLRVTDKGVAILSTPVERRLLNLSSSSTCVQIQQLKDEFVILATSKSILEQAYLPLLEFKGHLQKGKSGYERLTRAKAGDQVKKAFSQYDTQVQLYRKRDSFKEAHIYVTKKRDDRLIALEAFDECVRREMNKLSGTHSDDFAFAKSRLILMLLRVFAEDLNPKFQLAEKQTTALMAALDSTQSKITSDLDALESEFERWTGFTLKHNRIVEFQKTTAELSNIRQILDMSVAAHGEELKARVAPDDFSYKMFDDSTRSYNLKLHLASTQLSHLHSLQQRLDEDVTRIHELTRELTQDLTDVQSKLKTIVVGPNLPLCNALRSQILAAAECVHVGRDEGPVEEWDIDIALQEIATEIKNSRSGIDDRVQFLKRLLPLLRKLVTTESDLAQSLTDAARDIGTAEKTIDIDPYISALKSCQRKFAEQNTTYRHYQQSIISFRVEAASLSTTPFTQLLNDVEQLTLTIRGLGAALASNWDEFKSAIGSELNGFSRVIRLLPGQKLRERDEFESIVTDTKARLERSSYSNSARRMSDFSAILADLRRRFRASLHSFLSSDEASTLEALTTGTALAVDWTTRDALIEAVATKSHLPVETVTATLNTLSEKGLLIAGYKLPANR